MLPPQLFGKALNTQRNDELNFNYCLLFAKYYLYYQQIYSQGCNASEFVIKLEQKLNMRISSKESYSHEDTSDF